MIESYAKLIVPAVRALGPYLFVELLLPGGTLLALLLWLYQQRRKKGPAEGSLAPTVGNLSLQGGSSRN
jgi:hypothetical protein